MAKVCIRVIIKIGSATTRMLRLSSPGCIRRHHPDGELNCIRMVTVRYNYDVRRELDLPLVRYTWRFAISYIHQVNVYVRQYRKAQLAHLPY